MKKIGLFFLSIWMLVALTGCGGGGGGGDKPSYQPQAHQIDVRLLSFDRNSSDGYVQYRFDAAMLPDNMHILLKNFVLQSDGYQIYIDSINPSSFTLYNQGDFHEVTIRFHYRSRLRALHLIEASDLKLGYTKVIHSTLSGEDKSEPVTPQSVSNNEAITVQPTRADITISTKSFDANATHVSMKLQAQGIVPTNVEKIVLNNFRIVLKNGYQINGPVQFDPNEAVLRGNHNTVTINVSFDYQKRDTQPDIRSLDVQFGYNKAIVSANSGIVHSQDKEPETIMEEGTSVIQSRNYRLMVLPTAQTIRLPHQQIPIDIQLDEINGTHPQPAAGKTIAIEPIGLGEGSLDSLRISTNVNGRARVTYTAPERISDRNISLTFYLDQNGSQLQTTSVLQMSRQLADIYISPQSLSIVEPGSTQTVTITTVDQNNFGISADIQIENPNNSDGIDYGRFDQTHLTTDANGMATLVYHAPNENNMPYGHERKITIEAITIDQSKKLHLIFPARQSDREFYDISLQAQNHYRIDSNGTFTIKIHHLNDENQSIDNTNVLDVNVTSRFTNVLTFNGQPTQHYNGSANRVIQFSTGHIAGAAEIDVSALIFDGENNTTLHKSFTVIIQSGPVHSLSLVYHLTEYDNNQGLFHDYYTVHAVDRYGNPAKAITIYPSLIAGWIHYDANEQPVELVYGNGRIYTDNATNLTVFEDATNHRLDLVDAQNDHLIILPKQNRYDRSYLGGWNIDDVRSASQLDLNESYFGVDTDRLKYIIGNEVRSLRDVVCNAHIAGTQYMTDENGITEVEVIYNPLLVGHTYAFSIKSYEDRTNNRTGQAIRAVFKGEGYTSTTKQVSNDGVAHVVTLSISIKPTGVPLVGIDLTPDSITFNSPACELNASASNLKTDDNGKVTLRIETTGVGSSKCTISWINNNSGIYYEF